MFLFELYQLNPPLFIKNVYKEVIKQVSSIFLEGMKLGQLFDSVTFISLNLKPSWSW